MKTMRDLTAALGLDEGDVARAADGLDDATPWYVTLLAGFGTWVGATLLGIAMALSKVLEDDGARFVCGLLLLLTAPVIARLSKHAAATQAALIAVIAGEVLFGTGLSGGFVVRCVAFIVLEVFVIVAVNRPLTRAMATLALLQSLLLLLDHEDLPVDVVPLLAGVVGVGGFLVEKRWLDRPWSLLVRPIAAACVLAWLGFWTFEATSATFHLSRSLFTIAAPALHAIAGGAALVAVAVAAGAAKRDVVFVAVFAVVAAALSLSLPGLTAAFVVVAVGVAVRARLLTGLAVVFALFFLWLTYWRLDVTLLDKALWSLALGALLFVVRAVAAPRGSARVPAFGGMKQRLARRDSVVAVVACAVFVVVLGGLVVDKERTLAAGRRVLLPLVPRDPRSLAQGDYMALRTQVARDVERALDSRGDHPRFAVLAVDEFDVATLVRLDDAGAGLAVNEVRVELHGTKGNPRVGAEEFFFVEGDAARYAGATYGEVRVDGGGDVVLVGLCGEDKKPL